MHQCMPSPAPESQAIDDLKDSRFCSALAQSPNHHVSKKFTGVEFPQLGLRAG